MLNKEFKKIYNFKDKMKIYLKMFYGLGPKQFLTPERYFYAYALSRLYHCKTD